MHLSEPLHLAIAALAAFMAGSINSVAGGGTLISFPTLMWLGLPSITANATSTVAIWPGTLGSIWGFRRELRQTPRIMRWFVFPSVLGGATGAALLRITPASVFDKLVPFLILLATILFTAQSFVQERLRSVQGLEHKTGGWLMAALSSQFLLGIYGGYFGAGLSIMMLSVLGILGMTDILKMNGLTSMFGFCINGIAATLFIVSGMVRWHYVLVMAIAAIIGGYGAAGAARKIGRVAVRRFVVIVGFSISLVLFVRMM